MSKSIYLLLSVLAGVIEVGVVIYAINNGYTVLQTLFVVLAYQFGCFFPTNIILNKPLLLLTGCLSILFAITSGFYPSFWVLLLAIFLISPLLQLARGINKSNISTGVKRMFRIIGFSISPIFSPFLLSVLSVIVFIAIVYYVNEDKSKISIGFIPAHNLIMVVHQMHYFSYVYILLIIAKKLDAYQGYLVAVYFVLGWLTYVSAEYIFSGKYYFKYLIFGHIYLLIVLALMTFIESPLIRVLLWVLTGFGGGTVFCIKKIFIKFEKYDKYSLETAENYGHILGVVASIIIYCLFRNMSAPIFFACICAGLTVVLVIIFRLNEKGVKYD